MKLYNTLLIIIITLILAACSTTKKYQDGPPSNTNINLAKIHDAVPKVEPKSRYGNPPSYVVFGKRYYVMRSSAGYAETGIASWYGTQFHEKRTSSGEPYDMFAMTAAHKTLPLPTYVKVTNLKNGKQIIVKVNDRGPFHENRIIDLSYVAARKLDMTGKGTALVRVEAINPKHYSKAKKQTISKKTPKIYLQTGAFASLSNAKKNQEKLTAAINNPTRIYRFTKNQQTLYAVQTGPLSSVTSADQLTRKLDKLGFGHVIVVSSS